MLIPLTKGLHGCFPGTEFPEVHPFRAAGVHPRIKAGLQLSDRRIKSFINSLSERDSAELILHYPVKSPADAACLRASRLDFGAASVLCVRTACILRGRISPHPWLSLLPHYSASLSASISAAPSNADWEKGQPCRQSISAAASAFSLPYGLAGPVS